MRKFARKILEIADTSRLKWKVKKRVPVHFKFRNRRYWVNPDNSAIYHIKNSVAKIANMTDLIPSDAQMIFDVGGNCGLFSAFSEVSCPNAVIHCFEPSHNLMPIIRRNVSEERVHVHNVAIGDRNDQLEFFINRESEQTNSFNRGAVELFARAGSIIEQKVDCITLDSFAAKNGINKVNVLKVDVQGCEGAVFRGCKNLLSSVDFLFVESTWMDIESILEVIPFALDYGFTHASVLNPVYLGADILLSRGKAESPAIKASFVVNKELLKRRWR